MTALRHKFQLAARFVYFSVLIPVSTIYKHTGKGWPLTSCYVLFDSVTASGARFVHSYFIAPGVVGRCIARTAVNFLTYFLQCLSLITRHFGRTADYCASLMRVFGSLQLLNIATM